MLDVLGLLISGGGLCGYIGENNDLCCVNSQWNVGLFVNNGIVEMGSFMINWGVLLNFEYVFIDEFMVKFIMLYCNFEWVGCCDVDNMLFIILYIDFDLLGDQFSQEFQFNYVIDNLIVVVGIYYYEEEVIDILIVQVGDKVLGYSCGEGIDGCYLDSDNNII